MFLRYSTRKKDGKEYHYWSLVENRRVAEGRVVQRHVLYLGEINDESDADFDPEDKRRFGYSRDKRNDRVQVVIALVVTPEGFPIAYEVLAGNSADKTTLRTFLKKIEAQYGKADRIWMMDRGHAACGMTQSSFRPASRRETF